MGALVMMIIVIVVALEPLATPTQGSVPKEALPWTNWSQLKNEVSAGGHDGECPDGERVVMVTVTRGEADAFLMWNIATPMKNPERWAAVKFTGRYAEPVTIFTGSSTKTNDIIVESATPHPSGSDGNLCELLKRGVQR